jgi:ligand-binding sensor protein
MKLTFTLMMEVAPRFEKLGVFNTGVHKSGRQVARATNFVRWCTIFVNPQYRACYISRVFSLRILKRFLDFWKICAILLQ